MFIYVLLKKLRIRLELEVYFFCVSYFLHSFLYCTYVPSYTIFSKCYVLLGSRRLKLVYHYGNMLIDQLLLGGNVAKTFEVIYVVSTLVGKTSNSIE